MSKPNALIFIPDISGYTRFVNRTEISHQKHILTELLELLIDTNQIGLTLAEIEGDALLYYSHPELPSPQDLIEQIKKLFVAFHSHLRYYDKYRLCHCGACSGATGLTLKFVVHAGHIDFLKIKDRVEKPHGKDVILAHRLLKNDIDGHEYALFTQATMDWYGQALQGADIAFSFTGGQLQFGPDDVGDVPFQYTDLSPLKQYINEPEKLIFEPRTSKPLIIKKRIALPALELFEIIINFDHRMAWNKLLTDLEYSKNEMNKVGAKHVCVIGEQRIEVESVRADYGPDRWVYGERSKAPMLRSLTAYYIIDPDGDSSNLTVEVHPKPLPVIGGLFLPLFRRKFGAILSDTIERLKAYAEDNPTNTRANPSPSDGASSPESAST